MHTPKIDLEFIDHTALIHFPAEVSQPVRERIKKEVNERFSINDTNATRIAMSEINRKFLLGAVHGILLRLQEQGTIRLDGKGQWIMASERPHSP